MFNKNYILLGDTISTNNALKQLNIFDEGIFRTGNYKILFFILGESHCFIVPKKNYGEIYSCIPINGCETLDNKDKEQNIIIKNDIEFLITTQSNEEPPLIPNNAKEINMFTFSNNGTTKLLYLLKDEILYLFSSHTYEENSIITYTKTTIYK